MAKKGKSWTSKWSDKKYVAKVMKKWNKKKNSHWWRKEYGLKGCANTKFRKKYGRMCMKKSCHGHCGPHCARKVSRSTKLFMRRYLQFRHRYHKFSKY